MRSLSRLITALLLMASYAGAWGASPLIGDWQLNGGGATIRFVQAPGTTDTFDIIWIDGPDMSIDPGTVIGSATASTAIGVFDCRVSTDPRGAGDKKNYARFLIKLDSDAADNLSFSPYEQRIKFSIQALLPYWWRRSIREVNTRPANLDGARRVGAPKPYVEL